MGENMMGGNMMGGNMMGGNMMGGNMMGGNMMGSGGMGSMQDMHTIHGLLMSHQQVQYQVERIPNGVRAIATSANPQVARLLQQHIWQMKERMQKGEPIRMMDPLFRELFAHHQQIVMQVENLPNGVKVIETSTDPQVVLLLRQHAEVFVPRVVHEGMRGAMGPTPLPRGYRPSRRPS